MIAGIIAFSIRRRRIVILGGLALGLLGALAIRETPVDAIPDLSEDSVIVFADWPGHSPREVEEQVTYPISTALRGLRGARSIRSSSDFGYSWTQVILDESLAVAEGRRRVAERLASMAVGLPSGVAPKLGPDAAATGQIYWYTVEGDGIDPGRLRSIQDWYVRPRLASVAGVAEVAGVGGFPIEYQVAIDPGRLRARGLTLKEVSAAIAGSNATVGGPAIEKGNAEFLVLGDGRLGSGSGRSDAPSAIVGDIEQTLIAGPAGPVRVRDVASVAVGPGPRRGVLEKDGREAVGGVVLMASGENPLEVTRRIKARLHELSDGLPTGVSVVPFYDRTALIEGAIGTVRGVLIEAIVTATICVLVLLLHARASLVVAATLPLAVLGSFAINAALRRLGLVDIQLNIMSLAGIAISIGVLVDSSVVMVENALHRLREHFGDEPARGDLTAIVLPACVEVGRPIFFSVVIMLLSFLPVFALGGIEGKMFRPLAFTKTFALLTVAGLAITLVPALCSVFLRGKIRRDEASPIVRGVVEVYRPTLGYLLDRPAPLALILGVTSLVGAAPCGVRPIFLATLFVSLVAFWMTARGRPGRIVGSAFLIVVGLVAESSMTPIAREFLAPLDEGMIMDMPITVPRASVTQSRDDLKARDMALCRFPEVAMVVGKAGRADSPTDPAPIDMIETMVDLLPRELWPRRSISEADARLEAGLVLDALIARGLARSAPDRRGAIGDCVAEILPRFDVQMREYAFLRNSEFAREHAQELVPASIDGWTPRRLDSWRGHVRELDSELVARGAAAFVRLAIEAILARDGTDPQIASALSAIRRNREAPPAPPRHPGHHAMGRPIEAPDLPPIPRVEGIQQELSAGLARRLVLWKRSKAEILGAGSELDRAVQMPGWSNIWTMPIQNRVDMLSTGVNTSIGARVTGRSLDDVVSASEAIAAELRRLPGAVDVVADPIRGKGYLEIRADRERAARLGVSVGGITEAIEGALGGVVATSTIEGRERRPVRVRYGRGFREDEGSARAVLVPSLTRDGDGRPRFVRLDEVADVRIVEGPATIKGEDGMLRNYVRLNARGRDAADLVDEARRVVGSSKSLPDGISVAWSGQFEHEARARRTLTVVLPVVLVLILAVLYWTYRDLADALLMLLAVPGSIAGGLAFQWLLGVPFSVTTWVGYIACFGMATSTGIIMLVYLREAIARAGGLGALDLDGLRSAVLRGSAQRLRPKLLTEGITILGLAPMLWADGPGSEVIRPMAAPVLGGLLVADEVIDLLLPVLFYRVRRRRLLAIRPSFRDGRPEIRPDDPGPSRRLGGFPR